MELINQGIGVAIGDGRQTEFWNHRWLDGKRLIEHAICLVLEDLWSCRVSEFWKPGSGWEWAKFSQFLPMHILQRIASFDLGAEVMEDRPMWLVSNSSTFSIKSAIQNLQTSTTTEVVKWDWVWKLRVPHRIQVFLWLLLHRKILTNVERFRQHLSSDPQCGICLGEEENLDHLLRRCLNAQEVWQAIHSIGMNCSGVNKGLREWLHQNLLGVNDDPNWSTKFAIVLWYIWK